MEFRQRAFVGALWVAVAGVMAYTLEPAMPTSWNAAVRVFVVVLALGIASVYLLDPWNVISHKPFE